MRCTKLDIKVTHVYILDARQDKPVFHTLESENPTFLMTTPVEKPALNSYLREH